MASKKPTFIDLFAGAGGLSCGFEAAGYNCVLGMESDLWASQTFQANHLSAVTMHSDIRTMTNEAIAGLGLQNLDLIVGGPPCQGFSHSNTASKDPHDPRNSLFVDYLRFVKVLKPRVAIIENVPGLLGTRLQSGALVIQVISEEFSRLGYATHYEILDASLYGVPQRRPRLFILAHRIDDKLKGPPFPLPSHAAGLESEDELPGFSAGLPAAVTLWDAISDLPQIDAESPEKSNSYSCSAQNAYQKRMRDGAPTIITHHEPMRHTGRIVERFKHIGFGQSEEDVPEDLKPRKRGNPGASSGQTYSQNSRRQRPDRPCNTVVASAHTNFIHPFLHRNFTVRETMRIQSFPDWYSLKGKRAVLSKSLSLKKGYVDDMHLDQRMQIGNAVPPLLAEAIGRHLLSLLNFSKQ